MKTTSLIISIAVLLGLVGSALGQAKPGDKNPPMDRARQEALGKLRDDRIQKVNRAETDGIKVRIKDIARFRGVRPNQLMGVGVVFGLANSGDTRRNQQVARAIANYLRSIGQDVDPNMIEPRNGALVMVTAELPAFSTNGQLIDVTVSSLGDAISLRGGTLLQTELYAIGDKETVYAVAQGSVSIGGFGGAAGGNSSTVGFLTAGRVPSGAIVEKGAPTRLVYDGKMYIELADADFTSATRMQDAINKVMPEVAAEAENAGTIQLTLPKGMNPVSLMSKLEGITVLVDNAAVVVINEKTGAIAIGGNVRIAPVAIASGTISVQITEEVSVSQPNPFGQGNTAVIANQQVQAKESDADVAIVAPNTTVADLARIFQELRLKATDIINILQILKQQGALKAKLVIQ